MRGRGTGWQAALMALLLATAGIGCGQEIEYANGTLAGQVIATAPIEGAQVRVIHVMQDGRELGEVLAETVTDAEGRFSVEVGPAYDHLLIEARGGQTVELVTAEAVTLEPDVRMSAAVLDYLPGQEWTDLVVSPVSTMAEALGDARLARGDKEESWPDAQRQALALLGAHFGDIDPVRGLPADPTTTPAGTLDGKARYGLVLAALSELSADIAADSGVTANVVNSTLVAGALVADLSSAEALFDGMGPGGALALGACPAPESCTDEACSTICDIGPRTVREHLANALEAFIASNANVTGLALADIAEMKLRLAKNDEPELFGGAPTDTEGAPLTIDETGFWVDASTAIWWTRKTGQQILGTVEVAEGDAVTITVEVNGDVSVPGQLLGGGLWAAALPAGAFDALPATNTLRAIARDGVGNLTTVEHEVRVDTAEATVEFLTTSAADESADQIDFSTIPPTHTHAGPSVNLPGTGCPAVKKHVHLMDGTDNPLRFRFRATDTGAGLDPATVQYRVRKKASADWLVDWTTPPALTDITGGLEGEVTMRRADLAALGTDGGDYELEIRGRDYLGQGRELLACWNHTPLGPPLATTRVRSGLVTNEPAAIQTATLGHHTLANNNLAGLINGTSAASGAGVMHFDVENGHDEAVYFQVGWTQPSASREKTWVESAVVESVTAVNLDCNGNNAGNCNGNWTYSATRTPVSSASVPGLIGGARVWDVTTPSNPQVVNPCSGCVANRYRIEARPGAGSKRVYRVMLVATDLSALHPGPTDTGNYQELALGSAVVTGRSLGTFNRCTETDSKYINGTLYVSCTQRTTYRRYLALEDAILDVTGNTLSGIVRPAVSASGASHELESLSLVRPTLGNAINWLTAETLPAKPSLMPGVDIP